MVRRVDVERDVRRLHAAADGPSAGGWAVGGRKSSAPQVGGSRRQGRWEGTVARGLEWVDQAKADVQAQVDEPIVAVGFLQPGGSWGAFGLSKLNPVAGSAAQSDANK